MIAAPAQLTVKEPKSLLELQYIINYLAERGYSLKNIQTLPTDLAKQLMREACTFASLKLAEIEALSQFRNKIHYDIWR